VGANGRDAAKIAQNPLEVAVRELAGQQLGNVARRQLLSLGLGAGAIKARLSNGSFVVRYPAVYCLAPARTDPPALAAAAVLACGPEAVVSHASAAYLWGFVSRWQPTLEVTLISGDRRPRRIRVHRCKSLTPRDITRQRGIPVTSRARTILDIAPRLTQKALTRLVNDARRAGHLHPATFQDILDRNPYHPATKLLRPFAEDLANPTRSTFEDEFLAFAAEYGLPTPQVNVRLHGHEVDALFPEQHLIVECDGWEFHRDRTAFEDDRERDAENLKHGYATVRVTKDRLRGAPNREAERLKEILAREG
jgi:hypothetical protein